MGLGLGWVWVGLTGRGRDDVVSIMVSAPEALTPFESDGLARMFKTHPPLDARVRRLRELGAGQNGRVPDSSVSKLAR